MHAVSVAMVLAALSLVSADAQQEASNLRRVSSEGPAVNESATTSRQQHSNELRNSSASASQEEPTLEPCLCVFDVDRTLTGRQGDVGGCPRNKIIYGVTDDGYGSGTLTLSALAAQGISTTFCGSCYLGICSAGWAGGEGSKEREYLVEHVLRSTPQDDLALRVPNTKAWSVGRNVVSPLVVGQPDKMKQHAVEDIRQWFKTQGVDIAAENVFFFGDRTENMPPFADKGFNAREISCGSRDEYLYSGTGMVGYCGATPEEIVREMGISQCMPACQDSSAWTNGFSRCKYEGYGESAGCTTTGWTCQGYEYRGWCLNGRGAPSSDFAFGPWLNYPERNCCVCGGGSVGTCQPVAIRRRRRGGGSSTCSCRRRSGTSSLPSGWQCKDNMVQKI